MTPRATSSRETTGDTDGCSLSRDGNHARNFEQEVGAQKSESVYVETLNKSAPVQTSLQASVLIVDDHAPNLLAIEGVLDSLQYRLVRALSGEEALRKLDKEEFAAILLDVQMPGLDGFQTAERIRKMASGRTVPIVFMTAGEKNFAAQAYASGAVDFLTKPFDPLVLRSKVSVFVELFLARQEIGRFADLLRARAADDARAARAEVERAESLGRERSARADSDAQRTSLAAIFQQAPVPIAVWRGPQLVFELANEPYCQLVDHRELVGKPVREAIP